MVYSSSQVNIYWLPIERVAAYRNEVYLRLECGLVYYTLWQPVIPSFRKERRNFFMSINEKYGELLSVTPSTKGLKLPTAKEIRESEWNIVWSRFGITVYENGFYTYTDGLRTTVFAVDRCLDRTDKEFIDILDVTVQMRNG